MGLRAAPAVCMCASARGARRLWVVGCAGRSAAARDADPPARERGGTDGTAPADGERGTAEGDETEGAGRGGSRTGRRGTGRSGTDPDGTERAGRETPAGGNGRAEANGRAGTGPQSGTGPAGPPQHANNAPNDTRTERARSNNHDTPPGPKAQQEERERTAPRAAEDSRRKRRGQGGDPRSGEKTLTPAL